MAEGAHKPNVIVFGGCGFIGRNLVHYLIENDLVSCVRVVDKVPPQVAWLNKAHRNAFDNSKVDFRSANLISPVACELAFEGNSFDYVINCACETKTGQTDPVYKEGIYKVSVNCANAAANHNVKRFVEISSGTMFSSEKVPHKEGDKTEPWTQIAKFKLQVEDFLKTIPNFRYTILRPAIVYGLGDRAGIVPRLVIGGIYRHLGESMKLLWDKNIIMNTVHVLDVCRAIWHLCEKEEAVGKIYNIADENHTTQGLLSELISEIFNINHDYWGNTLSSICKTDINGVVEEVNDKHLGPWAEICLKDGVENTPLSPYIHQELLYNKHLNLDTSRLKNSFFTFQVPKLTKESLLEILHDYSEMELFPKSLLS